MFSRLFVGTVLLISSILASAAEYQTQIAVAQDGSGDFKSIQQAIYASKTFPYERITIYVKNGIYKEKVEIYSWNTRISLIGESREGTIISYDDYFDKIQKGRNSTFHTYSMKVAGNDFSAQNLTIINTSGPVGQAVALHVEADRASFENVILKGFQDTLYLAGEGHRSYFKNCYIEGSIDFIFGEGTALFEGCEIKSLSDGYVTAASTPANVEYGFVFKYCKLTAATDVNNVYLGRPWRKFARTVFMTSELGDHIHADGWHNWDDPNNEKTVFYAEYDNNGPGRKPRKRVSWSKQLSKSEAKDFSENRILKGWVPIK